jgi:catechol 2,3-dioxygenase
VHLLVSDLDRSLRFYTDVLGFQLGRRFDNEAGLTADGSTPVILLTGQPNARPKPPRTSGLYHYAILLPARADLARTVQHMRDVGYQIQGAADHRVSEALYLADPDGNGIEVYADRPRAAWPWRDGAVEMTTEPLDLRGLLAELHSADGGWQGVPAGTRIGHVHLHVADLGQAEDFYCNTLGFTLMQRFPPEEAAAGRASALFVSAGGYHHHVGLNVWAGVGAPPPPPDAVGLRWYTIHLPDKGELERTVERLRASGVELRQEADTLTLHDPFGNGIRLSTDR